MDLIKKDYTIEILQMEHMQRASFMISELVGAEDEQMFITGMIVLMDMKGFTMSHFTQMPISLIKKLTQCFEVFLQ